MLRSGTIRDRLKVGRLCHEARGSLRAVAYRLRAVADRETFRLHAAVYLQSRNLPRELVAEEGLSYEVRRQLLPLRDGWLPTLAKASFAGQWSGPLVRVVVQQARQVTWDARAERQLDAINALCCRLRASSVHGCLDRAVDELHHAMWRIRSSLTSFSTDEWGPVDP